MEHSLKKDPKRFTYSIILIVCGLGINLLLSFGARSLTPTLFPLYLDNVGTVLATMLGGALPGVIVGFTTNLFNSLFTSQLTVYFGTISVLVALLARYLFVRGYLKTFPKMLLSAVFLGAITGGLGAAMTWLIYGFDFGAEISAPLAHKIAEWWEDASFPAALTADVTINLVDKLIVVLVSCLVFHFVPAKIKSKFVKSDPERAERIRTISDFFRSLLGKVVLTMVAFEVILCMLVAGICYYMYKDTNVQKYSLNARSAAEVASARISADKVDAFLAYRKQTFSDYVKEKGITGDVLAEPLEYPEEYGGFIKKLKDTSTEYGQVMRDLEAIGQAFPNLQYLYVYRVLDDCCEVVFDIDPTAVSLTIDFDESFLPLVPDLLDGKEIDPIITDDTYGWLLTVYLPLRAEDGSCLAYVCVDISMNDLRTDQAVFIAKVVSLLFGASLIVLVIVLNITQKFMIEPINAISDAASEFAYDSADGQKSSIERITNLNIRSDDEIERLYRSLQKLATDSTRYIDKIKTDAETITKMQEGIIWDFANMVENRDQNTGDHIKKTSLYVRLIAEELRKEGVYADILTDDYIASIVRSAPLHDVGKIKISDLLLNKPGRLTPEEFEVMKTHTTAGYEILSGAMVNTGDTDYLREAINMAYSHHERWDGTGYPCGLKGEDIPLSARIMAVADVFDALVSRRSYKDPFPFDKAVGLIREASGTHFDPKVAQAFLAITEDLRSGKTDGNV